LALKDVLDGLGITPERLSMIAQSGMATNRHQLYGNNPLARETAINQILASQPIDVVGGSGGVSGGNAPGVLGDIDWAYGVLSDATRKKEDNGPMGWVGGAIKKAIDIIDTPRAAVVSLGTMIGDEAKQRIKGEGEGAGWDQFWEDTARNKGFQEVLDDAGMAGGWQRSALGFAGDVLADPTTYVGVGLMKEGAKRGLQAGVRTAADEALEAAVKSGGRNEIAKTLMQTATQAGLHEDAAVRLLVQKAAKQGRGALTERSLRTLGVSDELAAQLGIGRMGKTFAGKAIPGTQLYAEVAETAKGALKEVLGRGKAAELYRSLRVTDKLGKRGALNVLRQSSDPNKAWGAVVSLAGAGQAKRQGFHFVDSMALRAKELFGADLRPLDDDAAAAVTHAMERGEVNDVTTNVGKFFEEAHENLGKAGVTVNWRGNYVPHLSTVEARASEIPEVQRIARGLDDKAFFENERTLKAGDTFLGHKLESATIEEINGIAQRELGYKMFEDDIRVLVSAYIGQGGQSVQRATLAQAFKEAGVAVPKRFEKELDGTQAKALKEMQDEAAKLRRQQDVHLTNGVTIRRSEAGRIRAAVVQQRRALNVRIHKLQTKLQDLARDRVTMEGKIARLQAEVGPLQAQIDQFSKVAAKARGEARAAAMRKVRKAEKQLAAKVAELDAVTKEYEKFMQKHATGAARNVASSAEGIRAEIEALQGETARLTEDADLLLQANTELGKGPLPSEWAVSAEKQTAEWINKQVSKDTTKMMDLSWEQIDTERMLGVLTDAKAQLDAAYDKLRKLGRMNKNASDADQVRDAFNKALQFVNAPVDPELQGVFGKLIRAAKNNDAAAAIEDMNAWKAGKKAKALEETAQTMRDPNFGNTVKYHLQHGWANLDETHQIPGWLDDIHKAEAILNNPNHFPEASEFIRKAENLWKGYATARPGFLVRNTVSSLYSMFLEGGARSYGSLREFMQFRGMYRDDPTGYMERAVAKYGQQKADQMNEALKVISATGGGLAPAEFHTGFMHKASANPLSADFAPLKATRAANENIEAWVRGAHAYDVMRRGGTPDLALDTVEKYHFNYRDITRFDKTMKHIVPFWAFFSNNVALQSYVWTHKLDELNRSYFNLQRNMGYGDPQEEGAPTWFQQNMGLPVATDPNGTSRQINLGLPSIDFARDVMRTGDNPYSLLANTAPWIQAPLSGLAGKNLYTGRPLTGYRDAGLYGAIPGLGEATGSGGEAITPYQYDILSGMLPTVGSADRIGNGAEGGFDPWALASFLGVSTSKINENTRKYEAYRQDRVETAEDYKRKLLEDL
jgi:hypothetical protein